jgi:hypothetical protein
LLPEGNRARLFFHHHHAKNVIAVNGIVIAKYTQINLEYPNSVPAGEAKKAILKMPATNVPGRKNIATTDSARIVLLSLDVNLAIS